MPGQTGHSPGAAGGGVQASARQTGGTEDEPAEPAAAATQLLGATAAAHSGHQPAGAGGAAPAPLLQPRPDEMPPPGSLGSQAASREQVPIPQPQL